MDCQETLKFLPDLLDGELEGNVEMTILEHINKCWHCAEVKQNEAILKQLIREKLQYKFTAPSSVAQSIKNIALKK